MSPRISSKRALANQHNAAKQKRMNRFGRSALVLSATILSFGAFVLLAADQMYRPDRFVIDQLKIKGSFQNLKPLQVENIVNQQPLGNFFSIKLSEIKKRIENLAWVQNADVRREWPNTLSIEIKEQSPIMRWQDNLWVNAQGQIIDLPGLVDIAGQVILSGSKKNSQQMLQQALVWQQMLISSDLELVELSVSESKAYIVTLRYTETTDEFDLLLGRDQLDARLERFLMLFEHRYKHSNERLKRVDTRYPDGLAIKAETLDVNNTLAANDAKSIPNILDR